jgi:histidinol-phosphate aminotransferase
MISELCEALEGHAIVVLDETYAEFSKAGSMAEDLESTPNLIILRTLSKSYSFAGMRMGCFLCGDTDFVSFVKAKALDAYPLPRLSIEAAFHVLSPEVSAVAQENIKKILAERARVAGVLAASDQVVHIYPSDANFLLVEMSDAKGFHRFAEENNVILRDFSAKPGTENCLRISIGTPQENDVVLRLLEKFGA